MSCSVCKKSYGLTRKKKSCWSCQAQACSKCVTSFFAEELLWTKPQEVCSNCRSALEAKVKRMGGGGASNAVSDGKSDEPKHNGDAETTENGASNKGEHRNEQTATTDDEEPKNNNSTEPEAATRVKTPSKHEDSEQQRKEKLQKEKEKAEEKAREKEAKEKAKAEEKEAKQREKEAKEAKAREEKEAKEAKAREEKEAKEARAREEKEAKEAKAKEAKEREAKEREAKEAKEREAAAAAKEKQKPPQPQIAPTMPASSAPEEAATNAAAVPLSGGVKRRPTLTKARGAASRSTMRDQAKAAEEERKRTDLEMDEQLAKTDEEEESTQSTGSQKPESVEEQQPALASRSSVADIRKNIAHAIPLQPGVGSPALRKKAPSSDGSPVTPPPTGIVVPHGAGPQFGLKMGDLTTSLGSLKAVKKEPKKTPDFSAAQAPPPTAVTPLKPSEIRAAANKVKSPGLVIPPPKQQPQPPQADASAGTTEVGVPLSPRSNLLVHACPVCHLGFPSKANLLGHLESHSATLDRDKLKKDVEERTAATAKKLEEAKSKSKEKPAPGPAKSPRGRSTKYAPHSCPVCEAGFLESKDLLAHLEGVCGARLVVTPEAVDRVVASNAAVVEESPAATVTSVYSINVTFCTLSSAKKGDMERQNVSKSFAVSEHANSPLQVIADEFAKFLKSGALSMIQSFQYWLIDSLGNRADMTTLCSASADRSFFFGVETFEITPTGPVKNRLDAYEVLLPVVAQRFTKRPANLKAMMDDTLASLDKADARRSYAGIALPETATRTAQMSELDGLIKEAIIVTQTTEPQPQPQPEEEAGANVKEEATAEKKQHVEEEEVEPAVVVEDDENVIRSPRSAEGSEGGDGVTPRDDGGVTPRDEADGKSLAELAKEQSERIANGGSGAGVAGKKFPVHPDLMNVAAPSPQASRNSMMVLEVDDEEDDESDSN